MALEIWKAGVCTALEELARSTFSISENMRARVETPILDDETNLWETRLCSKTMLLKGGRNNDKRYRFKIDNNPDLRGILSLGADFLNDIISIDEDSYLESKGTEFIIIGNKDIKEIKRINEYHAEYYAIRTDKYESIKGLLNRGRCKLGDLKWAGGFKINSFLPIDEIPSNDIWLELAVGKNKATKDEYAEAAEFLKEDYIPEAEENLHEFECMPFQIKTYETDWKKPHVLPLCLNQYGVGTGAFEWFIFYEDEDKKEYFLRETKKDKYTKAYELLLGNPSEAAKSLTTETVKGLFELIRPCIKFKN